MSGLHNRFRLYCMHAYARLFNFAQSKWTRTVAGPSSGFTIAKKAVAITFVDFSQYLRLSFNRIADLKPSSDLQGLSRRDLRLLRTVPNDMIRLAPLLIAFALPGTIVLLPLFFAFPRLLLTRNFWTAKQKLDIDTMVLERRLLGPSSGLAKHLSFYTVPAGELVSRASKPISFRPRSVPPHRQQEIEFMPERRTLGKILSKLTHSDTPTDTEVMELAPLFDGPLTLRALNHHHITFLCACYELVPLRRSQRNSDNYRPPLGDFLTSRICLSYRVNRLERLAQFFLAEDSDLMDSLKSNTLLPHDDLMELCLCRGINGYRLDAAEMTSVLQRWAILSSAASETSYSFRLHLPYLLNFKRYIS